MVINTKGIEVNEANFVSEEGKYLFKIERWEEDGVTQYGDVKFKIFFKGVKNGTKEPLYLHSEQFSIGQKALWKIKQLEVALKAPEIYDINDFIGRYVVANIVSESYEKNGETKKAYKVKSWEYTTLNDKLAPIQQAQQNSNDVDVGNDEEEIDSDSLPF